MGHASLGRTASTALTLSRVRTIRSGWGSRTRLGSPEPSNSSWNTPPQGLSRARSTRFLVRLVSKASISGSATSAGSWKSHK